MRLAGLLWRFAVCLSGADTITAGLLRQPGQLLTRMEGSHCHPACMVLVTARSFAGSALPMPYTFTAQGADDVRGLSWLAAGQKNRLNQDQYRLDCSAFSPLSLFKPVRGVCLSTKHAFLILSQVSKPGEPHGAGP